MDCVCLRHPTPPFLRIYSMEQSLSSRLSLIVLPDANGKETRLGSFWASQPAVVVFLRHYGCIFCREHVGTAAEAPRKFLRQGRCAGGHWVGRPRVCA